MRRLLLIPLITGLMVPATLLAPKATAQDEGELDRLFDEDHLDEPIDGGMNYGEPPPPPPVDNFGGYDAPPPPPPAFPSGNAPGGPGAVGSTTRTGSAPPLKAAPAASASGRKVPFAEAQPEDITNENYPDLIESFDYPNAEVTDVIKAISELTGKNFIVDPTVRGKITIIAPTQITVAEAYKAFLSALAINGFTVVPSGKFLKIKSARNAQRDSIETYSGAYYPTGDQMITRIIHLKHISSEEVNKRLRILPSKEGEMTPYEPTNSLIISDFGSNIERIMKIITELDRPGFEEQVVVLPVRYAKAKDLAELISQIINKDQPGAAAPGGAFRPGVPRFRSRTATTGQQGGTAESLSMVAPDERTNALIVLGNQAGVAKVRELVKKLDYKLDPSEAGGVFVYYVKHGEAERIAQTLTGIAQTSGPSGPGAGTTPATGQPSATRPFSPQSDRQAIFGGDVKITADKAINSLVITASKQDYDVVRSLLAKIDIPRDQVYVEAIIMELNARRQRTWDVAYYSFFDGQNTKGAARAGFSSGNLQSLISPVTDRGAVLGFGSGQRFELDLGGGNKVTIPSLLAFVNFLKVHTDSNVLSTPQLLALNNEEAEIEVGSQIPIGQDTQTSAGGVTTTSTRFEKATIKLTVTPYISPDSNVVRMKLAQSVKQPSNEPVRAAALADSTVVITDRSLKTSISVNSGDTAVLGGLMRDEDTTIETKVPVLGDIPVLGWLFKTNIVQKEKVNLVIFLTPKIIRNMGDSQNLLSNKLNQRVDWVKKNFDGRDPYGQMIDGMPKAQAEGLDEGVEDVE